MADNVNEDPRCGSPALERLLGDDSKSGRVLRAAVNQVGEVGLDHVSVTSLLKESGVARGTVYAHFGDVWGVYATLWSEIGPEWLRCVMSGCAGRDRNTEYDLVFAELLCLGRRIPELAEVIRPDVEGALHDPSLSRFEVNRAVWLLAGTVGPALYGAAGIDVSATRFIIDRVAAMTPGDAIVGMWRVPEVPLVPLGRPVLDSEDDISHRLMDADVQVVAASGVAAASMLRICRSARLTPGAATPRFTNVEDLHARTFDRMVRVAVANHVAQIPTLGETANFTDFSALMSSYSLDPDRVVWRQYRQEVTIGAVTDERLAAMVVDAHNSVVDSMVEAMVAAGADPSRSRFAIEANLVMVLGVAMIEWLDLGTDLAEDTGIAAWLFESLSKHLSSSVAGPWGLGVPS